MVAPNGMISTRARPLPVSWTVQTPPLAPVTVRSALRAPTAPAVNVNFNGQVAPGWRATVQLFSDTAKSAALSPEMTAVIAPVSVAAVVVALTVTVWGDDRAT